MKSDEIRQQMLRNATEICRMNAKIHAAVIDRDRSRWQREAWSNACREFHESYDRLAFPGGFNKAFERIAAGDDDAIEAGVCFVECRPYFFRSGYMFKDLLRKLKRADLSMSQRKRLNLVLEGYAAYRLRRRQVTTCSNS